MASTETPSPLPQIPGPTLEPFRGTASAEIEFLEFLGDEKDVVSKVWKVRIDDQIYALKINWKFLACADGSYIMSGPEPSPQEYVNYLDPFHCECRAYGRLKQENREDLAVRAHGYLLLTYEQERIVTEALGEEYIDWAQHPQPLKCSGVFPRWEDHRHARVRAIVKDFVETAKEFTATQIPHMYADLEGLHELGILVRDIHLGNYLGGKLVDLSMAFRYELRMEDPYKMADMCTSFAYGTNQHIELPEPLLTVYGRPREEKILGFDPGQYNWRKWEADSEGEGEGGSGSGSGSESGSGEEAEVMQDNLDTEQ